MIWYIVFALLSAIAAVVTVLIIVAVLKKVPLRDDWNEYSDLDHRDGLRDPEETP